MTKVACGVTMIMSTDEITVLAILLTFLAGPINLRKSIATRPEGTREPDF